MTKVELGYSKSYGEFDLLEEGTKFDRPVVELHLGMELPLFAAVWPDELGKPKWGLAVTLPASVHVLEDMWGPITAPVINTDYKFGTPRFSVIRYFSGNSFFKNISLSILPMFHECTHLGDEIVIYRKNSNFPITRINISYEYTEMQLTLNDPDASHDDRHTFRLGGLMRVSDRGLGWFGVPLDDEITQPVDIPHSTHRLEYYLAWQWQRASGFLASPRFVNLLSFEARNRVLLGYPRYKKSETGWETVEVDEKMQVALNGYFGWKMYPRDITDYAVGLYLHAYRGINPYGQLRNYPGYPFFGVSLTYEP